MHRKIFFIIILIISIFFAQQLFAQGLKGKVVGVNGSDIKIRINSKEKVRLDGEVDIKFLIQGVEMLSIGAWEILWVERNIVYARGFNDTDVPQKGQKVVIYTRRPKKPMYTEANIKEAQMFEGEIIDRHNDEITIKLLTRSTTDVGDKITFYAVKADKKDIPEEVMVLIEKVQDESPAEKSKAIKLIIKSSHKKNSDLLDAVEEELLKGYLSNYRNSLHIDNMAWLCSLLGDSGNNEYKETLGLVYRETRHKKLKKYAYKNFRRLR